MLNVDIIQKILEILTNIVAIVVPICALLLYLSKKNKEREKETYDYVENMFIEFQKLCLEDLESDIFDISNDDITKLDISKKELIAFSILMSNFERAYIFYKIKQSRSDREQWNGWVETINNYFSRRNFREAWCVNGFGWDAGFQEFMDELLFKKLLDLSIHSNVEYEYEVERYLLPNNKQVNFEEFFAKSSR